MGTHGRYSSKGRNKYEDCKIGQNNTIGSDWTGFAN